MVGPTMKFFLTLSNQKIIRYLVFIVFKNEYFNLF